MLRFFAVVEDDSAASVAQGGLQRYTDLRGRALVETPLERSLQLRVLCLWARGASQAFSSVFSGQYDGSQHTPNIQRKLAELGLQPQSGSLAQTWHHLQKSRVGGSPLSFLVLYGERSSITDYLVSRLHLEALDFKDYEAALTLALWKGRSEVFWDTLAWLGGLSQSGKIVGTIPVPLTNKVGILVHLLLGILFLEEHEGQLLVSVLGPPSFSLVRELIQAPRPEDSCSSSSVERNYLHFSRLTDVQNGTRTKVSSILVRLLKIAIASTDVKTVRNIVHNVVELPLEPVTFTLLRDRFVEAVESDDLLMLQTLLEAADSLVVWKMDPEFVLANGLGDVFARDVSVSIFEAARGAAVTPQGSGYRKDVIPSIGGSPSRARALAVLFEFVETLKAERKIDSEFPLCSGQACWTFYEDVLQSASWARSNEEGVAFGHPVSGGCGKIGVLRVLLQFAGGKSFCSDLFCRSLSSAGM